MTVHPSVAIAAFAAGLVVGGGAYAASHDLGLGDGLAASAGARVRLERGIPAGRHGRRAGLLTWHAPRVPHPHHRPPPPAPLVQVAAVSSTPVAAPATSMSPAPPVTRTSPTGGDDDGGQDD